MGRLDFDTRRQLFLQKTTAGFDFLVGEFGFELSRVDQEGFSDLFEYVNPAADRRIMVCNDHNPYDHGFQVRLSRANDAGEQEHVLLLYRYTEHQDDRQEYVLQIAAELKACYGEVLRGERWVKPLER